jgi:hypothetical protein
LLLCGGWKFNHIQPGAVSVGGWFNVADLISASTPEVIQIALEYGNLAANPSLSEAQAERMGEVLELATHSPVLSFWVAMIDSYLDERLGWLKQGDRPEANHQQVVLIEYLEALVETHPQDAWEHDRLSIMLVEAPRIKSW